MKLSCVEHNTHTNYVHPPERRESHLHDTSKIGKTKIGWFDMVILVLDCYDRPLPEWTSTRVYIRTVMAREFTSLISKVTFE